VIGVTTEKENLTKAIAELDGKLPIITEKEKMIAPQGVEEGI